MLAAAVQCLLRVFQRAFSARATSCARCCLTSVHELAYFRTSNVHRAVSPKYGCTCMAVAPLTASLHKSANFACDASATNRASCRNKSKLDRKLAPVHGCICFCPNSGLAQTLLCLYSLTRSLIHDEATVSASPVTVDKAPLRHTTARSSDSLSARTGFSAMFPHLCTTARKRLFACSCACPGALAPHPASPQRPCASELAASLYTQRFPTATILQLQTQQSSSTQETTLNFKSRIAPAARRRNVTHPRFACNLPCSLTSARQLFFVGGV